MTTLSVPDIRFTYTSGPTGTGIPLKIRDWMTYVRLEFDVPDGVDVFDVTGAREVSEGVWEMQIPGDETDCPRINPEVFIRRAGGLPRTIRDDEMVVTAQSEAGNSMATVRLNG